MIDEGLVAELSAICAADPRLVYLSAEATDDLLARVAARFRVDTSRLWWWEGIPNARSVPYAEGQGLSELARLVVDPDGDLTLVVTGDEPPPWLGIAGPLPALLQLLNETPHFEFFVVDNELNWIVFDTHHDELVVSGL